jgi:AcrR family transcriptional regulator
MFMQAAARRARHRDEMRLEILSAARQIFVRYGVENFSMRTLARAVGYSPAAIYLHFTNKEELFEVLVEESFAHLYDALHSLLDEDPKDPIRQLKRGLRLYVEWGLKNPSEYQIAFVVRNPAKNPYRTHRAFDLARTLVKRCLSPSKVVALQLELRTQALWAAAHGITSLLTQRSSFPWVSRESVINQVIDSAVQGALGPARRRKAKRKN